MSCLLHCVFLTFRTFYTSSINFSSNIKYFLIYEREPLFGDLNEIVLKIVPYTIETHIACHTNCQYLNYFTIYNILFLLPCIFKRKKTPILKWLLLEKLQENTEHTKFKRAVFAYGCKI